MQAAISGLQHRLSCCAWWSGGSPVGRAPTAPSLAQRTPPPQRPVGSGLEQRRRLMSTQWERQQKAREEKLKNIQAQVEDGSLVIRKMTDEERKANPPRPPRERKPRR